MDILENWNEMDREFDRWDKTIEHTFRICIGLTILGGVLSIGLFWVTHSVWSVLVLMPFVLAVILYDKIGDRKIQAHIDRIDELKR